MGLDIGIIRVDYLPRPSGPAYAFAWELAGQETAAGYMTGEGGSWGWIERRQVSALLADFAARRGLSAPERARVEAWVASLPWDGADAVELHFGW
ncbi:MAG: hypothetical protein OXN15_08410 [Chloroflexota bacterium]|nr:hypothetical protein [Chloroflexota bacterium]MDE2968639.1 hypothetical protein [Chloroflexota bacterium]